MAMFENQPPRPTGAPGAVPPPPRPVQPSPMRPMPPSREPEDIFAGVGSAGPRMAPPNLPQQPKKGGRRIALVFLVFIIVILLIAGGVLAFLSFVKQGPAPALNLPAVNLNTPTNLNTVTNANANLNANVNLNTNAANVNAITNANANLNVNQPITPAPSYTLGADSDNDGLTNVEETLYGTNPTLSDTDNDGFSDGTELVNLFDPLKGNGALLANSDLIKIYDNPKFSYSIFYPAKWTAKATDATDQEVVFQSQDVESIKVDVEDNIAKSTLYVWLLTQLPTADLTAYQKTTTKGGFDELISPDNLTRYLTKEGQLDKVYVVTYSLGNGNVANYLSTLRMMVNSFNLPIAK